VRADNPVSYWRLGETSGTTAADSVGGNHGTLNGGITLGLAGIPADDSNIAMRFNGTTGYIQVANNANLNLVGDFTLELWARPTVLDGSIRTVLQKSTSQYRIGLNNNNAWRGTVYADTVTYSLVAPTAATVGQWHHLVLTRNGSTIKFYVNGVSVATQTNAGNPIKAGTGILAIGRSGPTSGAYFSGDLDEVAIYNTALPESRIVAHYNAGQPVQQLAPTATRSCSEAC